MHPAIDHQIVTVGVEEEFHIVDLGTRRLAAQADKLMQRRAAQSGLQGDLVDPVTATPVPAHRLIEQLLAELRPALESVGDWELVTGLTKSVLARGCSAARQRAARARGGLRNVVDALAAETRATPPWLQGTGPARPAVSAAR
jgi:gamma-glutamyl:cysteine ligase YbdK (ATP-grasp superfamily)